MPFARCKLVTVGKFCFCGECGRKVPLDMLKSGNCEQCQANCLAGPEYKAELGRLKKMTLAEREAYLAEQRAANETIEPGVLQQAWNYTAALERWTLAGRPVRSPERIAEILAICEACPMYLGDAKRPRCKLCGCSINNLPRGTQNKIAMATEHCPLDPPKWEAEA